MVSLLWLKKYQSFTSCVRKMTSCAGNLDDKTRRGEKFKKSRINLYNGKKISIKGGQAYEKTSGDKADRSVDYGSGNDGDRSAVWRSSIWK